MAPVRFALGPETEREAIERSALLLRSGGVALLPAEGLYGLHALASHARAVERIRAIKSGGDRSGFIGLLARADDLSRWADVEPKALELARRYWPGALTLVLPALPSVPEGLRAGDGTVALRCPGSAFLRSVVLGAGGLVLSTSANAAGEPPALRAADVRPEWADLVVDAGPLSGVPSTVARVEKGRVRVLREGALKLGEAVLDDRAERT